MAQQNGPNVESGTQVTEGFGSMALARSAETASSAIAAQAQAAVQARFIVAMKNPRDLDQVRLNILKECKRPNFADVARYHKPIGKGVEGPSIRFAEAAMRCMKNIDAEPVVTFDSAEKRIIRVKVTDLESNVTVASDVTIDKTVERSKVPDGVTPISTRVNSYGKTTYLIPATEDDLLNKQNALVSKAMRTNILRIVPGDIVDEAMAEVIRVQQKRDAEDPDTARKKLVDAFNSIGVKPLELKDYLGHDLDVISPQEMVKLRALYAAIRDGEANWKDALDAQKKGAGGAGENGKAQDLKERVAAKAKGSKAEAPKAEVAPPPAKESGPAPREPGDDSEEMSEAEKAEAARQERAGA